MNWYYFQTQPDGEIIRVKSKQMPKARQKSYIVHELYEGEYRMAAFPEIYGGRLLTMQFIGKHKVKVKKD